MEVKLLENERIDDLQFNGLKIIQNPEWFCFGIDAVLLSNFVKLKRNSKVVDLGTGTGIIPILLAGKSSAKEIYGVEIQEDVAEMASRSVKLNKLEDRVNIINEDLNNISEFLEKNTFDIVTSNPPYMHANGVINESDKKAISRHEIKCDIEDVIRVASELLKPNGRFFMVNRPLRLVDMMYYGRKYRLEAKYIRFVHSKVAKAPKLVLVEYVKCAKAEVKIMEPLYIYNDDNSYTEEILSIYANKSVEER
ncbi:tRNA1(Val) (adenine(37)-N6)-methyltransferase [Peptostreptococcus russellii]|uniref:tRNA1(Val) (adenine(37)-N6)-methyltransferase n=1 Tax=Peptostreptococcus russellii TaxID=215200 RepID=UPI00162ACE83|nr:tRNA1(Val) (adenine(37)-N6)-methyltransferase [Peptostreptococcus russellii]MBC2578099.1 tRNA1(Val) (adenine(37)-N6)-methyltransferase [Peptostreptococcus russellii]